MKSFLPGFLSVFGLLLCLPLSSRAQEVEKDVLIWGAVLRATDSPVQEGIQDEALLEKLQAAFPAANYEKLGEHFQQIFREYENWLRPSDELYMRIDSKGPVAGGGLSLNLQLWQRNNVLVKTNAVLQPDSPMIIVGPQWGEDDQLLFLVELRKKTP